MQVFRSETYRRHLKRIVRAPELNLKVLHKGFTAGFAKWRYETLVHALGENGKLRALCEGHLCKEYFEKVKHVDTLEKVLEACGDKPFWGWVSCSHKLLYLPIEKLHHWGMVCKCHEVERKEGRKITCVHDSRRLSEAWQHIQDTILQLRGSADNLDLEEDCEGDAEYSKVMVDSLRGAAVVAHTHISTTCRASRGCSPLPTLSRAQKIA